MYRYEDLIEKFCRQKKYTSLFSVNIQMAFQFIVYTEKSIAIKTRNFSLNFVI